MLSWSIAQLVKGLSAVAEGCEFVMGHSVAVM